MKLWTICLLLLLCNGCSMLMDDLATLRQQSQARITAAHAETVSDPSDANVETENWAELYGAVVAAIGSAAVLVDRRYFHNKKLANAVADISANITDTHS